MNRIEQAIAASPVINGRVWRVERRGDTRLAETSEITRFGGSLSFFPGHWAGKPDAGFGLLDAAAGWRHRALAYPRYRESERRTCLRRARECVRMSGERRVDHDDCNR